MEKPIGPPAVILEANQLSVPRTPSLQTPVWSTPSEISQRLKFTANCLCPRRLRCRTRCDRLPMIYWKSGGQPMVCAHDTLIAEPALINSQWYLSTLEDNQLSVPTPPSKGWYSQLAHISPTVGRVNMDRYKKAWIATRFIKSGNIEDMVLAVVHIYMWTTGPICGFIENSNVISPGSFIRRHANPLLGFISNRKFCRWRVVVVSIYII